MLNPKAFKMANRPVIHFQRNIDNQRPFRVAQSIGPAIEIAGQRQNAFHLERYIAQAQWLSPVT